MPSATQVGPHAAHGTTFDPFCGFYQSEKSWLAVNLSSQQSLLQLGAASMCL